MVCSESGSIANMRCKEANIHDFSTHIFERHKVPLGICASEIFEFFFNI